METSDRRDWMKQILGGVAVLATGGTSFAELPEEKHSASHPAGRDFWKQVDAIKARDLVDSAIKAAHAEVESQRAVNMSTRARLLLGGDADKDFMKQAETNYQRRTAELRRTKQVLSHFVKNAGESANHRFEEFVGKGGPKELADHARHSSIQALLHSDVSPSEAKSALKALDERLAKVQGMKSFQDATSTLDQHLDELIGRKMSQEDPNGFCVFILIITSIYFVLLIFALIFGALIGDVAGLFEQLIAQACPD